MVEIDPVAEINLIVKEKGTIQVDTDQEATEDSDPGVIEVIAETAIEAQVEKDGEKAEIQDQDLDQASEITSEK